MLVIASAKRTSSQLSADLSLCRVSTFIFLILLRISGDIIRASSSMPAMYFAAFRIIAALATILLELLPVIIFPFGSSIAVTIIFS